MPDLLVLCPHDCNLMIKLRDISRHIESAHNEITGACNYCNEDIRIRDWQDHLEVCKIREIDEAESDKTGLKKKMARNEMTKCNGCKKLMLKRNFPRHRDACLPTFLRGQKIIVKDDKKFELVPDDHRDVYYMDVKTFTVIECGREFSDFMCNKCGKTMPKSNLRRHSKFFCESNSFAKLESCEFCNKIMKAESIKNHQKICNPIKGNCLEEIDHEEVIDTDQNSQELLGDFEFLITEDPNQEFIIIEETDIDVT